MIQMDEKKNGTLNGAASSILIVDDEPLVRWSLQSRLKKAGYLTATASTAEQAMEDLSTSQFDLVITDMRLPLQDGFEVASAAKHFRPKAFVIMISAFGDDASKMHARGVGIEHFVDKPFDLNEIVALVDRLLHHTRQ